MNWIKQNVFATVLLAITLIGAGVLIFLSVSKAGQTAEINAEFQTQEGEFQRLSGMDIYPSAQNLKKLEEETEAYRAHTEALKGKIAEIQLPAEQISPSQFQDRLAAAVRDVQEKAATNGVEIAEEDFFLGFPEYRSATPRQESVPELNVMLTAILDTTNKLLDAHIARLERIVRVPLPSESGAAPAPAQAGNANKQPARKGSVEARKLLERHTFSVAFTAGHGPLQNFMNNATTGPQLVTMQLVRLENEQLKGPARTPAGAPMDTMDPSLSPVDPNAIPGEETIATDAGATPPAPQINFILGEERVNATIRFQIIRVIGEAPAKS